jgi:hypothetical protein
MVSEIYNEHFQICAGMQTSKKNPARGWRQAFTREEAGWPMDRKRPHLAIFLKIQG